MFIYNLSPIVRLLDTSNGKRPKCFQLNCAQSLQNCNFPPTLLPVVVSCLVLNWPNGHWVTPGLTRNTWWKSSTNYHTENRTFSKGVHWLCPRWSKVTRQSQSHNNITWCNKRKCRVWNYMSVKIFRLHLFLILCNSIENRLPLEYIPANIFSLK